MLTDSEFSIKGQCAINLMMTKLDIVNTFLLMKYNRNFIQMKTGRLKSYDSVCKKMQKKGLDLNFNQALEKINDLIGVRAVCAYVDDIYKVADLIEKQQDIRIIKTKDYVNQPKKSGYQSLVEFHAYIFNRWGQKLYEWTNPADGWDGTYNGKDVKEGVYYVLVKAKGADGRKYNIKRDVNLLRGYDETAGSGTVTE